MEAIILAGGYGTRLRHILPGLPKPMAPISGHPFLEVILAGLARKGFTRTVLSLGYMAECITEYFGDSYQGIELIYEIESMPLGTGGAARAAIQHCINDHIYIFNGDTYIDLEADDLENLWSQERLPIIVVKEVSDVNRYGKLEIVHGKVVRFIEKGLSGPGMINAGTYLLPRSALEHYKLGDVFSLEKDYLEYEVMRSPFNAFVSSGYFIDIGVPEDYVRAQKELPIYM